MSAGTPVVASDLDAFRRVLDNGIAGVLSPVGDAPALARALSAVLDDPGRRAVLAAQGRRVVAAYDWPVVAATVVKVYETVVAADPACRRRSGLTRGGIRRAPSPTRSSRQFPGNHRVISGTLVA